MSSIKKKKHRYLPYLVYLLVATILATGVSLSRFIKTDSTPDINSRAAVFAIDSGLETIEFNPTVAPGEFDYMEMTITAASEVAVNFTVSAELWFLDMPLTFMLVDHDAVEFDPAAEAFDVADVEAYNLFVGDNASYSFAQAPGETVKTFALFVIWPETNNGAPWTPEDYEGVIDIATLSVYAEQVD